MGDEYFEMANSINSVSPEEEEAMTAENEKAIRKQKAPNSTDLTNSLPIVVVKNFGSPTKEVLLEALAQWTAKLIENQVNK